MSYENYPQQYPLQMAGQEKFEQQKHRTRTTLVIPLGHEKTQSHRYMTFDKFR